MARLDRPAPDETVTGSGASALPPEPRQPEQRIVRDDDGGSVRVGEEEQRIAAAMLRDYGPAFERLRDL